MHTHSHIGLSPIEKNTKSPSYCRITHTGPNRPLSHSHTQLHTYSFTKESGPPPVIIIRCNAFAAIHLSPHVKYHSHTSTAIPCLQRSSLTFITIPAPLPLFSWVSWCLPWSHYPQHHMDQAAKPILHERHYSTSCVRQVAGQLSWTQTQLTNLKKRQWLGQPGNREIVAKGPTWCVKTIWQTPNEFTVCFVSGSLNLLPSSTLVTIGNVWCYGFSK